jgi:hypothetical protein
MYRAIRPPRLLVEERRIPHDGLQPRVDCASRAKNWAKKWGNFGRTKRVVSNSGIRTDGRNVHIADVATCPLVDLVLQVFDEVSLPFAPAMSCHESVG